MTVTDAIAVDRSPTTFIIRAAIGLLQGLALFALLRAAETKSWPATEAMLYAPLVTACVFVPLVAIVGFHNLRPQALALWTAIVTALCAALAAEDIFRDPGTGARHDPQALLWAALAAGLFIGHSLIVAGSTDRKYLAAYATDFAVSWKLALQGALAGAFVGAFWLLLWIGAELFRLIRIEFLADLIKHDWFWIPATTFVGACALHITDARAGFVEGTRTLALALLSWLLPVMTLFCIAFVLALPFTGLEPLWSTRRATAILLVAAAALVVLINAAYQDGRYDSPAALRYASRAAALVLVPLVGLAAYGLSLRVTQYGWTTERVNACACIVIAACYAIGYAATALGWRARLAGIEATNIATSLAVLAVLLALFTPIADPARIAVADQMRRLADGRVAPEKFDYEFLRFRSGRYGLEALAQIAAQEPVAGAAQRANRMLYARTPAEAHSRSEPLSAQSRAANITLLHAAGQILPERFLAQDWARFYAVPPCLVTATSKCEALMMDLDGDGTPEILLFSLVNASTAAFKAEADGSWALLGSIAHCAGVHDALRSGPVVLAEPRFKEIEVGRDRLRIVPSCDQNLNVRGVQPSEGTR